MIPRYSRPEMAAIWSPETRFEAHQIVRAGSGSRSRPMRRMPWPISV